VTYCLRTARRRPSIGAGGFMAEVIQPYAFPVVPERCGCQCGRPAKRQGRPSEAAILRQFIRPAYKIPPTPFH
jgi:hypothetical protein